MRRLKLPLLLLLAIAAGCAQRGTRSAPEPVYLQMGPLELSASVEQDGVDVMGSVDIMNTSGRPVTVEYDGGCDLALLIPGAGRPMWDQAVWWRANPDVCPTTSLTTLEIPARTLARILTPPMTTLEIAGDSIPFGTFPAAVRLRLLLPRDTTLVFPAGPLRLNG